MSTTDSRYKAAFALVMSAAGWGLAPVFIRYLSAHYSPHTQNFLRYGSATLPLLCLSARYYKADLWTAFRDWRGMGGIALLNVVHQHVWTVGCAGSTATTAQLISKLSIVFVIIFSFFLFHEERRVIRSPGYLLGTVLSLLGVAAIISRNPNSIVPVVDYATVMLLLTAILWGVYTVWAKHLVHGVHPVPMFTVVAVYTTAGFAPLAVASGDFRALYDEGLFALVIGIVSGLIPIAMAHPAFHYAQRNLGAAFCSSIALLNPLITYVAALLIFPDERLILTQWLGAGVLLLGTMLVLYTGRRSSNGI